MNVQEISEEEEFEVLVGWHISPPVDCIYVVRACLSLMSNVCAG